MHRQQEHSIFLSHIPFPPSPGGGAANVYGPTPPLCCLLVTSGASGYPGDAWVILGSCSGEAVGKHGLATGLRWHMASPSRPPAYPVTQDLSGEQLEPGTQQ